MIPRGEKISVPGYRKCIGHKQYIYTKYKYSNSIYTQSTNTQTVYIHKVQILKQYICTKNKYSGKISVYIVHCLPKPKGATHNRM